MALVRYRPLFDLATEFRTLNDELNRLFHEASPLPEVGFVSAAELSETEDTIEVRLELPGIEKDDLTVEVTAESVRVTGERKSQTQTESLGIKRSEFRYGSFERVINLPQEIVNTEAKADYNNGILTLSLMKRVHESQKVHKVQL
jgi:HSP20 family protein